MMDNLNQKLTELVNSPGGMEKLRAAAAALLGEGAGQNAPENSAKAPQMPDLSALLGNAGKAGEGEGGISTLLSNASAMGKIAKLVQTVQGMQQDPGIELIAALKPYLSETRAQRAEKAIRFLKIAAVIPLLKQQGLLDLFTGG